MSGTDAAYEPTRCPVLAQHIILHAVRWPVLARRMMLRACYTMPGTDPAYAATRLRQDAARTR
eukprot:1854793-Rhodomonas_salina.1